MSVSQLIPWTRNRTAQPLTRIGRDPFLTLHQEMNRLLDEVWRQFDEPAAQGAAASLGWPHVELTETERELVLTAELPGVEQKDVEVMGAGDALVLKGERRAQHEDANRRFSERYYGRFERRIPLDVDVQLDQARAEFRDGVLTVTMPKSAKAQAEMVKIPVKQAA